jgi:PIN domain nuclease of toxin-antitoxin system
MSGPAIDASVLLAIILKEPGWQQFEDRIETGIASAVNIGEVMSRLTDLGGPETRLTALLSEAKLTVIDFDHVQAIEAARLRALTRHAGLSLGDRACLALARVRNVPVLTADRAWAALAEAIGVEVELVR